MFACQNCGAVDTKGDSDRCPHCGNLLVDMTGREIASEDAPTTHLDRMIVDPSVGAVGSDVASSAGVAAPKVRIVLVLGRKLIKDYSFQQPVITIGRDRLQDIHVDDPVLSRRHCEIQFEQGRFIVQDYAAANPTTVNGREANAAILASGDEIGVGKHLVLFDPTDMQLAHLERGAAPVEDLMGEDEALTAMLSRDERERFRSELEEERGAHLKRIEASGRPGSRIPLRVSGTVLGRGSGADVKLEGWLIRAHHAEIIRHAKGFFVVRHVGGWRGVYVNGERVRECELRDRDEIRIGAARYLFYDSAR